MSSDHEPMDTSLVVKYGYGIEQIKKVFNIATEQSIKVKYTFENLPVKHYYSNSSNTHNYVPTYWYTNSTNSSKFIWDEVGYTKKEWIPGVNCVF